jgi:hypothetical protein
VNHKKANWKKCYLSPGQLTAVYPFKGHPYVGRVNRVKKNMFGRISYDVEGRMVMAEELFPAEGQPKLKIRPQTGQ